MFDVVTIGSATRDIFVRSAGIMVQDDVRSKTGKSVCFPLGSKIEVDEIHFETGGSAVNAAVTFANQNLHTGIMVKMGKDMRGLSVKHQMDDLGVRLLIPRGDGMTAVSVILAAPNGERTILVYRGVSEHLKKTDIPWDALAETKWLYVTHFGGESSKSFAPLMRFAGKHGISVAFNPGRTQLALGKKLIPIIENVKVFILNREEASYLTGVSYKDEKKIFTIMNKWIKNGIVVMTEGPDGVRASDGTHIWRAGLLKEKRLIDRTGAGDAFGSGFVSALIHGKSIEDAVQLGSANATGVLAEWGANNGLLRKGESANVFGKLKIIKRTI